MTDFYCLVVFFCLFLTCICVSWSPHSCSAWTFLRVKVVIMESTMLKYACVIKITVSQTVY